MEFDTETRNRLARMVADARELLKEEFTGQLQQLYGIQPEGKITSLDKLTHLDDEQREVARLLRERVTHLASGMTNEKNPARSAVDRMTREQAFTMLNRFAALRMCEERGIIQQCVGKGMESEGVEVYLQIAGTGLGDRYDRYCSYIFCVFDEIAVDLGNLFDRFSPDGLLFPREGALNDLIYILTIDDLNHLWAEDETIGWIYQYYNDPEERKKMRKASAAPRNSRELAVRNQFFTPRYVVEFLTDNTLGRIWYEMNCGQTCLVDKCRYLVRRPTEVFLDEDEVAPDKPDQQGLSQEELIRQPVYIPHRAIKDPREIGLLDPACGSMHFGLYAFDIFEAIYEEAWDNGTCPDLQETYPAKDEFLKDIPRLIMEHNIHGIDIDARAVQIAGLSLWLRCQKTWQAQGTKSADRPHVRRSNIVCAEPMPGSPEMLEEFIATLNPPLLGELVKIVFDKMQQAGAAGSLLKIEDEIRSAIEEAQHNWNKANEQLPGFESNIKSAVHRTLSSDFWETAEEKLLDALRTYAGQADTESYQRRLFADDTSRGFALIDLCRGRYDVVVMNPPFGEGVGSMKSSLANWYPFSWKDLLTAFVDMAHDRLSPRGSVGAISSRTPFFIGSGAEWRASILSKLKLLSFVDLGGDVLDSMVETAGFVLQKASVLPVHNWYCVAHRVSSKPAIQRANLLLEGLTAIRNGRLTHSIDFIMSLAHIKSLPLSPFVYWMHGTHRAVYRSCKSLEDKGILARGGGSTADDFRYVRLSTESPLIPDIQGIPKWVRFAKGGAQSKFHFDVETTVIWDANRNTYFGFTGRKGRTSIVPESVEYYFKPGLTFPRRTSLFAPRALPEGCVFGKGAQCLVIQDSDPLEALTVCASRPFHYFLSIWLGRIDLDPQYEVGPLQLTPYPKAIPRKAIELAKEAYSILLLRDCFDLTKSVFHFPAILHVSEWNTELSQGYERLSSQDQTQSKRLCDIAHEIDDLVASGYGLSRSSWKYASRFIPKDRFPLALPKLKSVTEDLVDWLVGVSLGRWDVRVSSDPFQFVSSRDPFTHLPTCQPGILTSSSGIPAEPKDVPPYYPLRISWTGILVDDENNPEDIVTRVREAIEVIWQDRTEVIDQEACDILGVADLRDYFRKPAKFFQDHLKRYSKSRRKAPIYWPISTASGNYTIWVYYHRLTYQTLFTCVTDYLKPKIDDISRDIERLQTELTESSSAKMRSSLEQLQDFRQELIDMQDELLRITKLPYKPNLNDGVMITAAPLWQLFRFKSWQKTLKGCWEKLEDGEYDWAHLAYSIWPERVKEKCKSDRSIAIAHDLEELCEVEVIK